jgi:hypothetical protein|tara:strand:- start:87 stop:296 length:210 start_codon:yes stop_codon:yes gene_type:complete
MATIITGKENIQAYRMKVLKSALKMELLGMKGRGRSAYSIIKSEFSLKGNKQKVFEQFEQLCNSQDGVK